MNAPAPLVLDRYEVVRRLGAGGMGEVYLARQVGVPGFERLVILKSLRPERMDDPALVEEFLDEARVAASLNHPNIVHVLEVGSWQGAYFIVMEHIHGADLAELMRAVVSRNAAVPWPIAAAVARDAALGLHAAHTAVDVYGRPLSVVHRDVSPGNIMVRADGVTKVVDFGIARAANRVSQTSYGEVKGKLAYMAPEQLTMEGLDGRCDEFALGVVLWELCAGRRLFKANTDQQVAYNLMAAPIPPLSTVQRGVPPELDQVVQRMLMRDRNQRFPSCGDAAAALRRCLSRLDTEPQVSAWVRELLGDRLEARVQSSPADPPPHTPAPRGAPPRTPLPRPPPAPAPPVAWSAGNSGFMDVAATLVVPRESRFEVAATTVEDQEPDGVDVNLDDLEDPFGASGAATELAAFDPWQVPVAPPEGVTIPDVRAPPGVPPRRR